MMGEPKPIASLTSGLLARKGQAKPAMRPQGFSGFGLSQMQQEDLGWNDMGHETAPEVPQHSAEIVQFAPEAVAEVSTAKPPVLEQQEDLERELHAPIALSTPSVEIAAPDKLARAAAGSKAKAAFTLRLDPERHLQLRLVCAVTHKSAQALVVGALDAFLASQPAVAALTKSAKQAS